MEKSTKLVILLVLTLAAVSGVNILIYREYSSAKKASEAKDGQLSPDWTKSLSGMMPGERVDGRDLCKFKDCETFKAKVQQQRPSLEDQFRSLSVSIKASVDFEQLLISYNNLVTLLEEQKPKVYSEWRRKIPRLQSEALRVGEAMLEASQDQNDLDELRAWLNYFDEIFKSKKKSSKKERERYKELTDSIWEKRKSFPDRGTLIIPRKTGI